MKWFAIVLTLALAGCFGGTDQQPDNGTVSVEDRRSNTPTQNTSMVLACNPCSQRVSTAGSLWEPHTLVDPANPQRLVAAVGDGGFVVYGSSDGGATWERTTLPYGRNAMALPEARWATTGDPGVAFLGDGRVMVVGLGTEQTRLPTGYLQTHRDVWSRTAHDLEFDRPAIITTSQGFLVLQDDGSVAHGPLVMPDREMVAANGNLALATWSALSFDDHTDGSYHADLMAAWSIDGSWQEPFLLEHDARPKGAFPIILDDGNAMVVFARYGQSALSVAHVGGQTLHLGVADAAPHAHAVDDHIAVVSTAEQNGTQRVVLYVSPDAGMTWDGPRFIGEPKASAKHPSVAWVGHEVWVGWYDAMDSPSYIVTRVHGANSTDLTVASGMQGSPSTYGDYVFAMNPAPDGATATYVVGDAEGRWLQHARLQLSAA